MSFTPEFRSHTRLELDEARGIVNRFETNTHYTQEHIFAADALFRIFELAAMPHGVKVAEYERSALAGKTLHTKCTYITGDNLITAPFSEAVQRAHQQIGRSILSYLQISQDGTYPYVLNDIAKASQYVLTPYDNVVLVDVDPRIQTNTPLMRASIADQVFFTYSRSLLELDDTDTIMGLMEFIEPHEAQLNR